MRKHNAENERIKRNYFTFQREAKRQSEATVDAIAAALSRFEASTNYRPFKAFHQSQAVAFKKQLAGEGGSGKALSKATQYATLSHLKRFFEWLSQEPGYRSHLRYTDAEYFNLSEKDSRVATARRDQPGPTLEQVRHVIKQMPADTDIELRNRALIAFVLLTGARDGAVASLKLKHIDLERRYVFQDAREVNTKFSKSFKTWFFPVGDDIREIMEDWVRHLRERLLWGDGDPLFPRTRIAIDSDQKFAPSGLAREHWSHATPIRKIFRQAFEQAGLPYANPHSLRKTLVNLGESRCRTPEEFKAWSQNLGHEGVLTTFVSYGSISDTRCAEIIGRMADTSAVDRRSSKAELLRLIEQFAE
ncbi:MAG: site-specific integrase [Xanthomonadales bacterium]|nr:site-specific integrase [Xanthomonadales bacterium]